MKTRVLTFILQNKVVIIMNILGFYLFAKMAEDVTEKESILVIDRWVETYINTIQTPLWNTFMVTLTHFNGAMGIFIFSLCMILFLIYKRWYNDLLFYILSVSGANIAYIAIKLIVQRARPSSELLSIATSSFPSGHATMATAMALALYFILAKRVNTIALRSLLLISCIVWPLIIAFSRVYLDVHWFSDVITGIGLGVFWVTLVELINRFKNLVD
ncbi:phosphatase PAP2 family protein [Sulfurovum sp. XGS-02]|uniref:phosphatase PAP2 family protein n=1 Tax=Sulfurovum sp. XGS-02 TaxID=2925411 RepID=UPI002066ED69|nr:phosphatase PAP2 family protein [Sulfurovum sp. XGS-02]UPT76782.1 phosphatase PAP2 family protein [Sulfurovum sp. XGS-02]